LANPTTISVLVMNLKIFGDIFIFDVRLPPPRTVLIVIFYHLVYQMVQN